jgi:predicted signal transduction protein with EAL and GGDEF domain
MNPNIVIKSKSILVMLLIVVAGAMILIFATEQKSSFNSDLITLSEVSASDISSIKLTFDQKIITITDLDELTTFLESIDDLEMYSIGKKKKWMTAPNISIEPISITMHMIIDPKEHEYIYGFMGRQDGDKFLGHGTFRSKKLRVFIDERIKIVRLGSE